MVALYVETQQYSLEENFSHRRTRQVTVCVILLLTFNYFF